MDYKRFYVALGATLLLLALLTSVEGAPKPFLWGGTPRRTPSYGNRPRPPLVAAHGPPHHPPHPHPVHHHHGHPPPIIHARPIHHPHAPYGGAHGHGPLPLTG